VVDLKSYNHGVKFFRNDLKMTGSLLIQRMKKVRLEIIKSCCTAIANERAELLSIYKQKG